MFLDKKKEDRLPDLLPIRTPFGSAQVHEEDSVSEESHALPSFPDSPSHNDFSQAAIKDAVGGDSKPAPASEEEENVKVVEMEEWKAPAPQMLPAQTQISEAMKEPPALRSPPEKSTRQIVPPVDYHSLPPVDSSPLNMNQQTDSPLNQRIAPPPMREMRPPTNTPQSMDVFVKIDKFHSAKKTLGEVREKLEEVDKLIKKIRETKLREEQEIASWERDLTFAKTRIEEISDNIFDKIE